MCILSYYKLTGKIRCLLAKIWNRPSDVNEEIWRITQLYHVKRCWVDGANVPETQNLMLRWGDPCTPSYHETIQYYKNVNKPYSTTHWIDHFRVRPINFGEDGRSMLINLKLLRNNSLISFHPTQKDMQVALTSAKIRDGYLLDKKATIGHDLIDAARLAAKSFSDRSDH